MNVLLVLFCKLLSFASQTLNLGSGSTWPGHIALSQNPNFIKDALKNSKVKTILVAGTNGKTTTSKLIRTILEKGNKKVFQNTTGANLLNGIASSLIENSKILGYIDYDYAIFEIDENTLPLILKELTPDYIVLLNLFRDQLDRYGEVDSIARKWQDALKKIPKSSTIVLNADDPEVSYLGKRFKGKALYFGLKEKGLSHAEHQHASDSAYCPACQARLVYDTIYFSHIGIWHCKKCGRRRPKLDLAGMKRYPLAGSYNKYNTLAAVLTAKAIGVNTETIEQSLNLFTPAFGRQEMLEAKGKKVQILLSKNPASLNESLRTIKGLHANNLLFVLNDRVPDGRDVSWIWDADIEEFVDSKMTVTVAGDRAYDMGLRMKYSQSNFTRGARPFQIKADLDEAIDDALQQTERDQTLYILPTYSAMLEVRKILTGRKIL